MYEYPFIISGTNVTGWGTDVILFGLSGGNFVNFYPLQACSAVL